jgi:hydroxymethylpyrimidine pyrophosphatase-like HAD family hydrolase
MIENEIEHFRKEFPHLNFTYIADPMCIGFHWLGLMPANTGKENLLRYFKKQYDAEHHQILAAGDDMNDIGMLKEAGFSIAMGSAPDAVKKIASLCIGTAQDESLCKYLKLHFLS